MHAQQGLGPMQQSPSGANRFGNDVRNAMPQGFRIYPGLILVTFAAAGINPGIRLGQKPHESKDDIVDMVGRYA